MGVAKENSILEAVQTQRSCCACTCGSGGSCSQLAPGHSLQVTACPGSQGQTSASLGNFTAGFGCSLEAAAAGWKRRN